MFACGDSGVWVAPFFEKLAHFLTFVVKIGVVTTKRFSISKRDQGRFLEYLSQTRMVLKLNAVCQIVCSF